MVDYSNKKVKDFFQLNSYSGIFTTKGLAPQYIVNSYIFTEESKEIFSSIFENLLEKGISKRKPILIYGDRGVGKTHTLSVSEAFLKDVELLKTHFPQYYEDVKGKKYFTIEIFGDTKDKRTVKELFYIEFGKILGEKFNISIPPVEHWIEVEEVGEQMNYIVENIPEGYEAVFFLDDIAEKLLCYNNLAKIMGDLEFLSTLADYTGKFPIFLVATFYENLVNKPSWTRKYDDLHQKIIDYDIDRKFILKEISKSNLIELIKKNILVKSENQRNELKEIYRIIKREQPFFEYDEDLFIDIYPIHPIVFKVSFYLHRYIKNFSLLNFIYSTANKMQGYKATSLATVDMVFDLLEYEFRKVEELKLAIQSYDTITKYTIAKMEFKKRLMARLLLKALFLFSLVEGLDSSITNLMDSLMLSSYQGRPVDSEEVKKILDLFEDNNPQCIRKLKRGNVEVYQLVTSDHASIDYILDEALKDSKDTIEKEFPFFLFSRFFENIKYLNITQDNYNQPISTPPLDFVWRGTRREGVVSWFQKYNQILVANINFSSNSLFERVLENKELMDELLDLNKKNGKLPSFLMKKRFDWQLAILSPIQENFGMDEVRNFIENFPNLMFWIPEKFDEEDVELFKKGFILNGDEFKYRFFDLEDEYEVKKESINKRIDEILVGKYLKNGIIATSIGDFQFPEDVDRLSFVTFLYEKVEELFSKLFPKHPNFENVLISPKVVKDFVGYFILKKGEIKGDLVELAENVLFPLGVVEKKGKEFSFDTNGDSLYDSPYIGEILNFLESSKREVFPLEFFYTALMDSPFGFSREITTILIISLVAAGKIELFNSSNGDIEALNSANLSEIFDISYYDAIRISRQYDIPIDEIFEWGFKLCETDPIKGASLRENRNKLMVLLSEWIEYETSHPIENVIAKLPDGLLTTSFWRDVYSVYRNRKVLRKIVKEIIDGEKKLEDGLFSLAKAFSNNLKALEIVNKNYRDMKSFIEWSSFFFDAKNYITTSDKTDREDIENLRYELSTFFERPFKLMDKEKRISFHEKFLEFKNLYIDYYVRKHNEQMGLLLKGGEFDSLLNKKWFKNLKLLSNIKFTDDIYIKKLSYLSKLLREGECHYPVESILSLQPYCWCGFRINSFNNISNLVTKFVKTAFTAKKYYAEFFQKCKRVLIKEMQKMATLKDDIAREIVSLINGNFDIDLSFDTIKLINFILEKRVGKLNLLEEMKESEDFVHKNDLLLKLNEKAKKIGDMSETYFTFKEKL